MRGKSLVHALAAIGVAGLLSSAGAAYAGQSQKPVTFSKDVAPIFQSKCLGGHQEAIQGARETIQTAGEREGQPGQGQA